MGHNILFINLLFIFILPKVAVKPDPFENEWILGRFVFTFYNYFLFFFFNLMGAIVRYE